MHPLASAVCSHLPLFGHCQWGGELAAQKQHMCMSVDGLGGCRQGTGEGSVHTSPFVACTTWYKISSSFLALETVTDFIDFNFVVRY